MLERWLANSLQMHSSNITTVHVSVIAGIRQIDSTIENEHVPLVSMDGFVKSESIRR